MTVEELYHTADYLIRVSAQSIPELFSESAKAMFRAMYGECNGNTVTEEFTLEAGDMEELLHDFLSELLFLSDIHEAVFCFFQVEIEGTSLSATIRGVPFNREKHQGTEIKGVSYYGLEIVKGEDSYATDILFDM